jgi:cytochrome c oxidase accessory protein FixG
VLNARPVEGRFRRLRWAADGILIAILLTIPWIRISGEPLILLDVPGRKFHVFGLVIFPQELYFLWLILAALSLALFFFTALAGRLWCGWACPQTVLTDVFAGVARRIEGWTRAGRPAHVAPWRKLATHFVWLTFAFILGFHLVSYFVSPYTLLAQLSDGNVSGTDMGFLLASTVLAYGDLVFLRQTFCKYLCPYARFQGVLFDRDTLVVGYDHLRGEPRGKRTAHDAAGAHGDCVDCGLCVAVCPTGIDIRNGMQLECIACTQCIDACDGVMAHLARPRGLIDYRSLVSLERLRSARFVRPRVVLYAGLLLAAVCTFVVALARREPLDLQVAHNATTLAMATADGRVGNAYTLHIQNRDRADHRYRLSLEAPAGFELVAGMNPVAVAATSSLEARVFVLESTGAAAAAAHHLRFVLEQETDPSLRIEREATFISGGAGGASGGR